MLFQSMKERTLKYSDIFVPGGLPTYTYNPRENHRLEQSIQEATENFKLLVVTGPTKSGKTVLVNKVFPRTENLWIDGGSVNDENAFWELIVSELGGYTEEEIENGEDLQVTIDSLIQGEANFVFGRASANLGGSSSFTEKRNTLQKRHMSNKTKALSLLQETKVPLIIDDFHYIPKDTQKLIVRALKAPIMYGVPVICIAIPNRKFDVIDVEREITGRMNSIEMPSWEQSELEQIAISGFSALNIVLDETMLAFSEINRCRVS